jgi:hypothetical protein
MKSLAGLLVVALLAGVVYKYYFANLQSAGTGTATPTQTIDIVGVKNDLLGIAQAERAHLALHGSYASLDELTSSGELTMNRSGRNGYTYSVETGDQTFRAVAHCPTATYPGCSNFAVDQSMEVRATQ